MFPVIAGQGAFAKVHKGSSEYNPAGLLSLHTIEDSICLINGKRGASSPYHPHNTHTAYCHKENMLDSNPANDLFHLKGFI